MEEPDRLGNQQVVLAPSAFPTFLPSSTLVRHGCRILWLKVRPFPNLSGHRRHGVRCLAIQNWTTAMQSAHQISPPDLGYNMSSTPDSVANRRSFCLEYTYSFTSASWPGLPSAVVPYMVRLTRRTERSKIGKCRQCWDHRIPIRPALNPVHIPSTTMLPPPSCIQNGFTVTCALHKRESGIVWQGSPTP